MIEKIVFVNASSRKSCIIMSPEFISLHRKVRELYDSKQNQKVEYLELEFDKGTYTIDSGDPVTITATIEGENSTYTCTNMEQIESAMNSIYNVMGNLSHRLPEYMKVIGDGKITVPTDSEEVWVYIPQESLQDISVDDTLDITWDTDKVSVYTVTEIREEYLVAEHVSGDAFTETTRETEVTVNTEVYTGVEITFLAGKSYVYTITFYDQFKNIMEDVAWEVNYSDSLDKKISIVAGVDIFVVSIENGLITLDTLYLDIASDGYSPMVSVDKTITLV